MENDMTTLSSLKLVTAVKPTALAPIVQKRNKLIKRLYEQIELAKALVEGREYTTTRLRTVKDAETNETKTVSMPVRVKAWWWSAENGKLCVTIKYGAKTIELAKGKSAVELASKEDLVSVLETLKAAVNAGELDEQINALSATVKSAFKK